jgi:D-Tyr-tRNAtyr deacylase
MIDGFKFDGSKKFSDEVIDFAKSQKNWAIKNAKTGNVPPTVLVKKDDRILAVIIAPQIDKNAGLQAAAMCHAGFDPDSLTIILDAHVYKMPIPDGKTKEEIKEEYKKKFPPGAMQKMFKEGNGEIVECIICCTVDRGGETTMNVLPYNHDKGKDEFQWLENDVIKNNIFNDADGYIPNNIRNIMAQPSLLEQTKMKQLAVLLDYSPERARFHTARVFLAMLSRKGFLVADYYSGTHPEWTDAKEKCKEAINFFVQNGNLPKEAEEYCFNIIEEDICTPRFKTNMIELLKDHPYWLSPEIRENIEHFVIELERIAVVPHIPPEIDDLLEEEEAYIQRTRSDNKPISDKWGSCGDQYKWN